MSEQLAIGLIIVYTLLGYIHGHAKGYKKCHAELFDHMIKYEDRPAEGWNSLRDIWGLNEDDEDEIGY